MYALHHTFQPAKHRVRLPFEPIQSQTPYVPFSEEVLAIHLRRSALNGRNSESTTTRRLPTH
ncbi:hypothetical protein BV25DRAFT_1828104 [Artomyces pyxidatus]|uniref:Uncharacterized protein n=1 Tax=Artomyces pyxidatus TaxID=48021 RepID=A0ACB8SVV6_9AGAM|nr:hypothetical protein BV25DRAFT_1828104 [Artomyces pyxidatus]